MIDGNIDRRLVVKFTTLTENEEKAVVSELIIFIYYYYLQTSISKNPDSNKVFEYYDKYIKKPSSIERLLYDFDVQVDAIRYIEETYNMIVLIMEGLEDDRQKFFIDKTKDYQRVDYLATMIYLLDKNKENEKVKGIIDYLKKYGINERNISDDYIKRIVNKAAEHYHYRVIEDLKVNYDSEYKIPIGTFTCKCGFVYTRRGTAESNDDRYSFTRIKAFGHVWEDKLKELVNLHLGLRETARRLGVDATTIKKYAQKLGLKGCWCKEDINDTTIYSEDNIKDDTNVKMIYYRKEWIKLREQFPDKSKKELRELNKAVYIWLYRNDKEWLNDNSPVRKLNTNINKRVDWEERDIQILKNVKNLVEAILTSEGKPERISVGLIGKKLGINSLLEKHLIKMPKTREYIETVKETSRDFHIRKIKWTIRELDKEGQEVLPWKVFRRAGIREEYQKELYEMVVNLIEIESNDRTIRV